MAASTPSLQELSSSVIASNLGKLAGSVECLFSCGGTIPQVENIVLCYMKKCGDWSSEPLKLPAELIGEDVQVFLDSCSPATFGIGSKTVLNKEYRNALKLEPGCFSVNFELASTFVLDQITRIMSSTSIRAELYKLNVYSTGGHFKHHVGTPCSADMFGSLVVCLPSKFTGGALVIRHQGRQVMFDWSSSTATQWAAFYSDVEHEVLPVTSGHRITLTYNLYHTSRAMTPAITTNTLYCELKAALQNPHFMRQGGVLGFFCQHKYTSISTNLGKFSPFLKGEDALIYEIAYSLKLSISLKPVTNGPSIYQTIYEHYDSEHWKTTKYIISKFHCKDECGEWRHGFEEGWKDHFGQSNVVEADGITWCQDPKIAEHVVKSIDSNPREGCDIYQAAAFLVDVPEFSSQRASSLTLARPDAKRTGLSPTAGETGRTEDSLVEPGPLPDAKRKRGSVTTTLSSVKRLRK